MDEYYKYKYIKYKQKYLSIKNQTGGADVAVGIKRLITCPLNEDNILDEDGNIIKRGKNYIKNIISELLNFSEIKNNKKFKELIIDKYNNDESITILELKHALKNINEYNSHFKFVNNFFNSIDNNDVGNINQQTQQIIDYIISMLDCACNVNGIIDLTSQGTVHVKNTMLKAYNFIMRKKHKENFASKLVDDKCIQSLKINKSNIFDLEL